MSSIGSRTRFSRGFYHATRNIVMGSRHGPIHKGHHYRGHRLAYKLTKRRFFRAPYKSAAAARALKVARHLRRSYKKYLPYYKRK